MQAVVAVAVCIVAADQPKRRSAPLHRAVAANNPLMENLALLSLRGALESLQVGDGAGLLDGVTANGLPTWNDAGLMTPSSFPIAVQEIARGASWPDDPFGALYTLDTGTSSYSSSTSDWRAEYVRDANDRANLVARAHRSDLSFVNAMASSTGVDASTTLGLITTWSRFLASVAEGSVDNSTMLSATTVASMFPTRGSLTVAELLAGQRFISTASQLSVLTIRQRAAGALLALVADSNSPSHTERDPGTRDIKRFYSASSADTSEHGSGDIVATGTSLADIISKTPGAVEGVDAGRSVLIALATASQSSSAVLSQAMQISTSTLTSVEAGSSTSAPSAGATAATTSAQASSDDDKCDGCPETVLGLTLGLLAIPLVILCWSFCFIPNDDEEADDGTGYMNLMTWLYSSPEGFEKLWTLTTFFIHLLHPLLCVVNYLTWVRDERDGGLGNANADTYLAFTIMACLSYILLSSLFYTLALRFPAPKSRSKRRRNWGVMINLLLSDAPVFALEVHFLWEVGADSAIQVVCFIVTCISFAYSGLVTWLFFTNKIIQIGGPEGGDVGRTGKRGVQYARRRRQGAKAARPRDQAGPEGPRGRRRRRAARGQSPSPHSRPAPAAAPVNMAPVAPNIGMAPGSPGQALSPVNAVGSEGFAPGGGGFAPAGYAGPGSPPVTGFAGLAGGIVPN
eukprot:Hpha_TRINITY_DN8404_c0_g1::TRINITY_DN8404_c0_g1_i1::g.34552::m.34552